MSDALTKNIFLNFLENVIGYSELSKDFKRIMIKYSSKIMVIVLLGFLVFSMPAPETEAMEPISLALMLAPIVIPIVKAALPYIIRGAVNMGGAMFEVGVEMCRFFYFPLGLFEMTLGAPFGLFPAGVQNLVDGSLAFPKSFFLMCCVPLKTVGAM